MAMSRAREAALSEARSEARVWARQESLTAEERRRKAQAFARVARLERAQTSRRSPRFGQSTRPLIVPGKWYVCDRFSPHRTGPFGTKREAEKERRESNIADDLVVMQAPKR